ncbi:unnamed protein product [Camellia sinensis]
MSSSSGGGFFKGCRALMAASKKAKSSAATTAKTTTTTPKPKPPPPRRSSSSPVNLKSSEPRKPTGIQKVSPISPALHHFLGVPEVTRTDAVKKIWDYIRLHNLQNPTNKKEIYCDDKLKTIFDGKDKVGFLEIGGLLSSHFVKTS